MTNQTLNEQFFKACENGNTAEAKRLFDAGADLEHKDENGNTALSMAASSGNTETVVLLMICGADKESRNRFGYTPLIFAASSGEPQTCLALLDHGADIEAKSNAGHSSLSLAARYGLGPTCEALLERNADVESKGVDGLSALALAAKYDEPAAIPVLIAYGADVGSVFTSRKTSLFAEHVCNFLQYPLHNAAEDGFTKACIQMLELGYDMNQKDGKGMTPLQNAEVQGQEETVSALRSWSARQEANRVMRDLDGMKP